MSPAAPERPAVTLGADGTFTPPTPQRREQLELPEEPRLAALMRLRALLGDDPEEQIGTRLSLPAALGTAATDHLLPASLALLEGTTGDLAPYGWRIGTGAGRAWQQAVAHRLGTLEAARIALLGYEGPLSVTSVGPASLAAASFLATGERALGDTGLLRDLPMMLAEGLRAHLGQLAERVPGARSHLLLREESALAVARGVIPTPSGRRRYAPVPAPEIGVLWRCLLAGLEEQAGLPADEVTVLLDPDAELLREARSAGVRRLAVDARALPGLGTERGRAVWEVLAQAHDDGDHLELLVDPRPGNGMTGLLDGVLDIWRRLGHAPAEAAGFTLVARTGPARIGDPAAQPGVDELLDEAAVESLLRAAPAWAERILG